MADIEIEDFAFVLKQADRQLESEAQAVFPDGIISPAENFLGGMELAVILPVLLPLLPEILEKVLQFVTQWRNRYQDASVTINKTTIDLKGYSPGDALKIIEAAGIKLPGEDDGTSDR